jgi:hypothetical protein
MTDINSNNGNIEKRFAILIDGDNAQASLMEQIVVEASRFGNPHEIMERNAQLLRFSTFPAI